MNDAEEKKIVQTMIENEYQWNNKQKNSTQQTAYIAKLYVKSIKWDSPRGIKKWFHFNLAASTNEFYSYLVGWINNSSFGM